MPIVTSTIKGQVVIPAEIRKKFKIVRGTRVNVYEDGHRIIMEPLQNDPIQEGRGMLKSRGRVLKSLMSDRQKEAALASRLKTPVVTGDPEFKKLDHQIAVQWIDSAK